MSDQREDRTEQTRTQREANRQSILSLMKKVFADHGLKEGDDYILIPWDYSEGNLKIRPREGQDITVAYSKEVDDYNAGRRAGETSAGETIENKIRKTAREIAERKRPTRKIGFQ